MSDKIIQFNDAMFESKLDALVRVKAQQRMLCHKAEHT